MGMISFRNTEEEVKKESEESVKTAQVATETKEEVSPKKPVKTRRSGG